MKKIIYTLFLGIFLVSINSCCTEEYCVPIRNAPSIYYVFSGYEYVVEATYYKLNSNDYSIVDSLKHREQNDETLALIGDYNALYYNESILDFKDYNYVIKTISRSDTIYNIDFTTSTYKAKCHTCFLANGKEEFTEIQNFSFYHKGIQYFDGDTVKISM